MGSFGSARPKLVHCCCQRRRVQRAVTGALGSRLWDWVVMIEIDVAFRIESVTLWIPSSVIWECPQVHMNVAARVTFAFATGLCLVTGARLLPRQALPWAPRQAMPSMPLPAPYRRRRCRSRCYKRVQQRRVSQRAPSRAPTQSRRRAPVTARWTRRRWRRRRRRSWRRWRGRQRRGRQRGKRALREIRQWGRTRRSHQSPSTRPWRRRRRQRRRCP